MTYRLHSCQLDRIFSGSRVLGLVCTGAMAAALIGCSGFVPTASDTATGNTAPIQGSVHGGQQPVSGSHIYLYATGSTGYGSAASSILKAQPGATLDPNGNYYVTTNANGAFAFTGFTCPAQASTQTYLLALGGNPGFGGNVNNTAISAVVPGGPCSGIGTASNFAINEVTTVAMITAAQQFTVDSTHVGGSTSVQPGLTIAMNRASDLVNFSTGVTNTVNATGTGSIPTTKVDGIGNALAPCLNAATATDPACTALFAAVTPSGGTRPTDIVGAMLLIAKNPGNNVANIYGQATATPPYQPTVSASTPPQDLTLAITYSGGGLTAPGSIVIDASGNAYIGNSPSTSGAGGTDSIVVYGKDGTLISGANGYTSGIHAPSGLAIDNAGNVWSTDTSNTANPLDQVVKQSAAGVLAFAFNDANISNPRGIAIDSGNNAWVANQNNSTLVKISSAGADSVNFTSGNFAAPTGIGIDGAGNIWAAGTGSNSILKFSSAGAVSSPADGYMPGLNQPLGISIDNAANVWTINNTGSTVSKIDSSGTLISPSSPSPSISDAYVIAIDGAGGAWFANCRAACGGSSNAPDNLTHLAPNQSQSTGTADGYMDPHLSRVGTAAIDGSGNVWVTSNGNGTVSEFLGIAPPVVTPLAVAVATNKLGVRP